MDGPPAQARAQQGRLPCRTFLRLIATIAIFLTALPAGALRYSNPQVPQGGNATFPKTGTLAPAGYTWQIVYGSSTIATNSTPNGWTVSYNTTSAQFTVGAPGTATIETGCVVKMIDGGPVSATFDVVAGTVALSSVTVSPASVIGGAGSTGTATLNLPAPSGGVMVGLSSNSGAAAVPSSLTVAQGYTTANFNITTTTVTNSTAVTITGSYNGGNQNAALTVLPQPVLSALTVNPSGPTGGTNPTGTATISSAAPANGVQVSLSSNAGCASVPSSVTVTSGHTSANFTVTTTPVAVNTPATITGSYNSTQQQANMTVYAPTPSGFSVSPSTLTGGQTTTATLTIDGRSPTGGIAFQIDCSNPLAAAIQTSPGYLHTFPTSVTVPAGQTSVNFTIMTSTVNYPISFTMYPDMNPGLVATITLNPGNLHATDVLIPQAIKLAWTANATGSFVLQRGVVVPVPPPGAPQPPTMQTVATLANTVKSYTDTFAYVTGTEYYYALYDSNNMSSPLSTDIIIPGSAVTTEDQAVDSRLDLRYSTTVYQDHAFGSTTYLGGLFAGFGQDPSRVGRSVAKIPIPAIPAQANSLRCGSVWGYLTDAYSPNGQQVNNIQIGCQSIPCDTWTGSTLVWSALAADAPNFNPANAPSSVTFNWNPASPSPQWYEWPLPTDIGNAAGGHSASGDSTLAAEWAGTNESNAGWAYFSKLEYNQAEAPTATWGWAVGDALTVTFNPDPMHYYSTLMVTLNVNGLGPTDTDIVTFQPSTFNLGGQQWEFAPWHTELGQPIPYTITGLNRTLFLTVMPVIPPYNQTPPTGSYTFNIAVAVTTGDNNNGPPPNGTLWVPTGYGSLTITSP